MALDPNSNAAQEVNDQTEYNRYLNEAPIADFAKFVGVDIDTAVKMRVAAALEASQMTIDATVRLIEPNKNLLGYANVTLNGAVTVTDFKVLRNEDGELFVGAPSKKDPSSRSGYSATVWFKDADLKQQLNEVVAEKYAVAVDKLKARAAAFDTEKPRIADQMKEAGEKAAKHNAERTAPPKGKDKNAEL